MKLQVSYYLQFSLLSSLYGNAGSPLHIYEQLLASGHIEKAIQAPVGGFSAPSGMAFHHDVGDAMMHESAALLKIIFDQMATKFYKAVVFDGSDLLRHYKTILSVTSISELDVKHLTRTLGGAKRTFKGVTDNMSALQLEVHTLIENVRERIRDLKREMTDKENKQHIMEQNIEIMENEMRENEMWSDENDRLAREANYAARVKKTKADEAAKWGAGEILGAAGFIAAGYATGGLIFAIPTFVLGGLGVKNAKDAIDFKSQSEEYEQSARRYKWKARELRSNIQQTQSSVSNLKQETQQIKHLLFQLESSLNKANAFSDSLHNSVRATYQVISILQNMEVAIKNAELDTESLQQSFKHIPHVFEKAESILKTTQSAWGTIQELLKMHYKLLA